MVHPPNPWESTEQPGGAPGAPPPSEGPPQVVLWFKIYVALCAVMYAFVAFGGFFLTLAPDVAARSGEDASVLMIQGVFMIVLGIGLTALYVAPFFVQPSRTAWILGIVCIGITLTSCCFLPFGIPLLIYWLKPETKAWYGA
jgi:hypothetical protein